MEHRGFVLIADITGYTTYLTESELAHAQGTLTDLLELLVNSTRAPFVVAQLEGDAVMSYAFEDGFVEARVAYEDDWIGHRYLAVTLSRKLAMPQRVRAGAGWISLRS